MKCILVAPTRIDILLEGESVEELRKLLTYENKSVSYERSRLENNYDWISRKYGVKQYYNKRNELLQEQNQCLLFKDAKNYWTYSGLLPLLVQKYDPRVFGAIEYPRKKTLLWNKKPTHSLRPFQTEAVKTLLNEKHGGVEIATGLGKTLIALQLVKELGLPTVILTPSISIAEQFYNQFLHHFGARYVGGFFGKLKNPGKLITIAVAQSLRRVKPGTPAWNKFEQKKIFIADESHMYAAKTLAEICFGVLKQAPYRFFFSATQMRNDGTDLLLEALTNKILMKIDVKEGVGLGYLAKPEFYMFQIPSEKWSQTSDPNELTREHLYYNPLIHKKAVQCVERFLSQDKSVLVLIDEIKQFQMLYPLLKHHNPLFAYGGAAKGLLDHLPEQYRQSDVTGLVEQFNAGQNKLLIGTGCIGMGTDLPPVQAIVYLQGNRSEILIKQAVGRGTRKVPGKESFYFVDFDVYTNPLTHNHAIERKKIYGSIYGTVNEIKWESSKNGI